MLPKTEEGQKLPYDWLEAADVWWLVTLVPVRDITTDPITTDPITTIAAQPSAKTPGSDVPLLQPAPCPSVMSQFSVPWELVQHYA